MGSDPRPPRRRPRCPRATWLVDVGALDQEGDPDVGAVLVEVLAPDARADDVDCADVPQRGLRLLQRLHRRVVAGRLRAANQLDDLDYGHSLLLFVAFRVPGPDLGAGSTGACSVRAEIASRRAACCQGLFPAPATGGGGAVSARNCSSAATTAAASVSEAVFVTSSIRGLGGLRVPFVGIPITCSRLAHRRRPCSSLALTAL